VNIQALGKACGCRIPPNTCALCPGGQPIPEPDKKYKFFANIKDAGFHEILSRPLRCDIFDSMLASPSMDDEMCIASTFRSGACGCENKFVSAITLITRISGSVSCACSLFIIIFVIFSPKQRQKTYNQIVLAMSIFDFCSSIGFAFASSLAPEELGIQGAKGNDATCKFQGFLIELGITSTVFNLCLSVYYWLVIVRGWTDSDLQKYRGYVYVGSIIIGLSLATAGFPHYVSSFRECHIHPPPMAESWWPIILLYIVPISLCILGSTTAIVLVILHVRRKEIKSKQFSARSKKSSLTRKCVKQAFYYLAAFYLVWPFMFVPIFLPLSENLQWMYVLTSIIGPSQGLFNFLIFFQRRNTQMNPFFCCRKSTTEQADTNLPRVPPVTSGLQSSDDECSSSWTLPNTFNAIWEHCHHAQL